MSKLNKVNQISDETNSIIEFKGSNFTLPVVYVNQNSPDLIKQALKEKIASSPSLFMHAPVVVNVSHLENGHLFDEIYQAIKTCGLHIVGFSGCQNAQIKERVIANHLPIINEGRKNNEKPKEISPAPISAPLFINTPIRSGQQIYAHNRDLIVNSLVSTGAEIISDGNIYVFGTLRGKALAGATGNKQAQIYCADFTAELISIAGQYWLSDNIPTQFYGKSVRIVLNEQTLVINEFNLKGTG